MTDFENFDFGIRVKDEFSTATRKFQEELRASRAAFLEFRKSIRALNQDSAKLKQSFGEVTQTFGARRFRETAKAVDNVTSSLQRGVRTRATTIQQIGKETGANVRLNATLREQIALLKERNEQLRRASTLLGKASGRGAGGTGAPTPVIDPQEPRRADDLRKGVKRVKDELSGARQQAERLRLPLLDVLKTVFAITAIRRLAGIFSELVTRSVDFNKQLEQSTLGIAALVTASAQVRDQFGESVGAGEALRASFGIAREQIRLLQQDAVNTNATLRELSEAFQQALAPGLTAGLDIGEVRQFAVLISQAASSLGVAQNQLSEEIRSILAGTIQLRTTRIAAALGITNDDIRRAKEAGTLFEFLTERFSAFNVAGREALNTFAGLRGRIEDVLERVVALSGLEFFEELKQSLREIFDILVDVDQFGVISPSPEAVSVFNELFAALTNIVRVAREAAESLSFEEVLATAQALNSILTTLTSVVINLGRGAISGFGAIRGLVSPLVEALRSLAGGAVSIADLATRFGELAVVIGIANLALRVTNVLLTQIKTKFGLVSLVVAAVIASIQVWVKLLTGADLSLEQIGKIVGVLLVGAFRTLVNLAKALAFALKFGVQATLVPILGLFDLMLAAVQQMIQASATLAFRINRGLSDSLQASADSLVAFRAEVAQFVTEDALAKSAKDVTDAWDDTTDSFDKAKKEFAAVTAQVLAGGKNALPVAAKAARSLAEEFASIPPFVSTVRNQLADLADDITKSETKARGLRDELDFEVAAAGLPQAAQRVEEFFSTATKEARETTRALREQVATIENKLIGLQQKRATLADRINGLTESDQRALEGTLGAQQQLSDEIKNLQALKAKESELEDKTRRAAQENDTLRAQALQKELEEAKKVSAVAEDRVNTQKEFVDLVGRAVSPEVAKIALQGVQVERDVNNLLEDRRQILQSIRDFQRQQLGVANLQAEAESARASSALKVELPTLRAQAEAAERLNAAESERAVSGAAAAAEAENQLQLAQLEQAARERELVLSIQSTQLRIEETATVRAQLKAEAELLRIKGLTSEAAFVEAQLADLDTAEQEKKLALLKEQLALEGARGQAEIDRLERAQQLALKFRDANVFEGFTQGLKDVGKQIGSAFAAGIEIATGLIQGFTSFVASSIVDAFDPTKDFDILENFARFLQQIATLVLQKLTELAVAEAILKLSTLSLAEGGSVPGGQGRPSLAHYAPGVRGYARGRKVRPPRGVDRRDTVPAWLQPREWVMQLSAVRKYGDGVMAAINEGMIDPGLLRGAAEGVSVSGARARAKVGFATGGRVPELAKAEARRLESARSSRDASRPAVAVSLADKQEADRLFNGGSSAVDRFFRNNKGRLNADLAARR